MSQALFTISVVLGLVACGSSLLLLWAALDSWNPNGIFHKWGIGSMPFGKVWSHACVCMCTCVCMCVYVCVCVCVCVCV